MRMINRVTGGPSASMTSLLPTPDDYCALATDPVLGTGKGSFTQTDNSVTGVGPGMNSFGFQANAALDLSGSDKALFHAIGRFLYDGEDVRVVVDDAEVSLPPPQRGVYAAVRSPARPDDPTPVVDILGSALRSQRAQVGHNALPPDEGMDCVRRRPAVADDLARVVDGGRHASRCRPAFPGW